MSANARRALKALETLARAKDFELAELKRTANAAADRLKRTQDAIRFLVAALLSEAPVDGAELNIQMVYTRYAAGSRSRRDALASMIPPLQSDVAAADAAVLEGFRALKQLEEAAKTHREDIAAEFERKERAETDDMAAVRAIRRQRA
jgi:hypothetical protein